MGIKILLIEDNPDHVLIVERILRDAGRDYNLHSVNSSGEGLTTIVYEDYNVVLCDYNMPGLSGMDVMREIKDEGKDVPFIVITSAGNEKVAVDLMKEGAYDYVVKDLSFEDTLPMVIEKAVEKYKILKDKEKAEKALQESEEKYRTLFQISADGILIADIETKKIKYANPSICRMLGYSEEKLNNMGVEDIHPKDELGYVIAEFEAQARGEKTLAQAISCLRKDGTVMYADFNSTSAIIDGTKCNVSIIRDITDRKVAEEEKERLQRQIVQSEKMASLGEIAAGIAHELNTPLNVILGYQELLQKRIDADSPYQEYLRIAIEEVEQCRQLIHDFMTYARPSAPEDLKDQSINFVELLKSSFKLLVLHKIQNIKVHLDIEENIPPIQGSQKQIMQVFVNLINNAIQAMPKGGDVSIVVKHNGEGVEFRVCDTGEGIPEENITKVFDPFFTTKRPGKGTGLGLAVCQRIIENHKGTVRIESELGKGTTVIGRLPAG